MKSHKIWFVGCPLFGNPKYDLLLMGYSLIFDRVFVRFLSKTSGQKGRNLLSGIIKKSSFFAGHKWGLICQFCRRLLDLWSLDLKVSSSISVSPTCCLWDLHWDWEMGSSGFWAKSLLMWFVAVAVPERYIGCNCGFVGLCVRYCAYV